MRGVRGTLGLLGNGDSLASNSQSHLVFGTDVGNLVGHPFLVRLVGSEIPLRWKGLGTCMETAWHKGTVTDHTSKPRVVSAANFGGGCSFPGGLSARCSERLVEEGTESVGGDLKFCSGAQNLKGKDN